MGRAHHHMVPRPGPHDLKLLAFCPMRHTIDDVHRHLPTSGVDTENLPNGAGNIAIPTDSGQVLPRNRIRPTELRRVPYFSLA